MFAKSKILSYNRKSQGIKYPEALTAVLAGSRLQLLLILQYRIELYFFRRVFVG